MVWEGRLIKWDTSGFLDDLGDVIVAVGDGHVLVYVAGVQHVVPGGLVRHILVRSSAPLSAASNTPTMELALAGRIVSLRTASLGKVRTSPSGSTVSTGSTSKGVAQYWLNMVTRVSRTILALVRSVAVTSKKIFFVLSVIFECSPLIIGGRESTTLLLS